MELRIRTDFWNEEDADKIKKVFSVFNTSILALTGTIVLNSIMQISFINVIVFWYSVILLILNIIIYWTYGNYEGKKWMARRQKERSLNNNENKN